MYKLLCEYITFIEESELSQGVMMAADNAFDILRLKYRNKIMDYVARQKYKDDKNKKKETINKKG